MITTYHIINYGEDYDTKEQFIEAAETEYQEELENITPEDGYVTFEKAKKEATENDIIYEVRWIDRDDKTMIFDYEIVKED